MNQTNASRAKTFYTEMAKKNIDALELYVHPDIELITPLAKHQGKEAYLAALKNFMAFFNSLTIRTQVSEGNQALVIYEVDFPAPMGKVSTASLMTFQDGLISKVELFFDASPFQPKL